MNGETQREAIIRDLDREIARCKRAVNGITDEETLARLDAYLRELECALGDETRVELPRQPGHGLVDPQLLTAFGFPCTYSSAGLFSKYRRSAGALSNQRVPKQICAILTPQTSAPVVFSVRSNRSSWTEIARSAAATS